MSIRSNYCVAFTCTRTGTKISRERDEFNVRVRGGLTIRALGHCPRARGQ
ncbi:unnamed protein product [Staurois parvus]|uniref:Uncharacterized protein n=1 Tax=Staurois parvus TaxID=386267 RepID=A0ABN9CMC5_9NEOB|nr:unnamed protein product [Staurois parvus]